MILIGKNEWIDRSVWNEAIRAKNKGTATAEQKELLNRGHWKDIKQS